MALRINTNISALNSHKSLVSNDNALSESLAKLSSGLRINKAADDASGMSIADSLKSQALGLGQAIRNGNDAISVVQTADAALQESINIVNTIKTKAIQAAQDGQTTESRKAIQSDISKLMEELDMIAETTAFNNQKLLFGNFTNKKFQMGAYSGETVNVSIASAQSTKIGHVTTGNLSISGDAEGLVQLSIYSTLKNEYYNVQTVEIAYDNDAEHSMGALGDQINKLSDVLGISASAVVESTTNTNVQAGTTDSDFAINGVVIGSLAISENDSDGSLVKAINQKTNQHGVVATVDYMGYLTLTSTDDRAIDVTAGSGTLSVLGETDMSTLGYLTINQEGAADIVINDIGGGSAVSLESNLEIDGTLVTTMDSTAAAGSLLQSGSVLGAGWEAGQSIFGTAFTANLTTTEDSVIAAGSILGDGTELYTGTVLGGTASLSGIGSTIGDWELAAGTILTGETQLAAGTVLGGNAVTSGDITVANSAFIKEGSIILSGSTFNSGTVLGGDVHITTVTTAGTSELAAGTILTAGTEFGANTVFAETTTISGAFALTGSATLTTNSMLLSGSEMATGTILSAGVFITTTESGTVGSATEQTILGQTYTVNGNQTLADSVTLSAGSILNSGGDFSVGEGSYFLSDAVTLGADTTLTSDLSVGSGTVVSSGTIETGSYFTGASITASGTVTIVQDMTLASGSVIAASGTLAVGSTLAYNDVAIVSTMVLTQDMAVQSGSLINSGNLIAEGSTVGQRVALDGPMVVNSDMTVKANSTLTRDGTYYSSGSVVGASATLNGDLSLTQDWEIGASATFISGSYLSNGSTIGGDLTLANDETVAAGTEMLIANGSVLAEGTVLTQGTLLTTDIEADDGITYTAGTLLTEDITTAGENTLTADMTIQENSVLAAGTVLAATEGAGDYSTTEMGETEMNRLSDVNVLTQEGAQKTIAVADAALKDLDKVRADLGSVQNQLTVTIANISTTRVNVYSAESSIRDVDFADEASNFTRLQILTQASTFAMAQANASAQNVLSLLQ